VGNAYILRKHDLRKHVLKSMEKERVGKDGGYG
jgi:hypothetical protein